MLLRHVDAFAKKRDVLEQGQDPAIRFVLADSLAQAQKDGIGKEWPLIVVGTTSEREKCSEGIAGVFGHEIEITVNFPNKRANSGTLGIRTTRYFEDLDFSLTAYA